MTNILDPKFHYVPAAKSDIRKTFAKWRRDYARDYDAAHAENAFRNMVPANLSVLTVRTKAK